MKSSRVLQIAILVLGIATLTANLRASSQQGALDGQVLHILVGKSVIVNVEAPITRVLSSNPGVIGTLATSPRQVVVEGKAAGSSSLIVWDDAGRSQMLDVVVDVDVTGLRSAIEHAYPAQHVDVESTGGRLMLSGTVSTPQMIDDLTKMAGLYSPQVVNSLSVNERQLLLEVKFAEVDRTAISQFGINLLSTGAGNTIGTTTTGQYGQFGTQTITDSFGVKANPAPDTSQSVPGPTHVPFTSTESLAQVLNIFLFNPAIHFGAMVQALQEKNVLQVLAEPNLMAINGQKASFLAGGEFPFPVIQPGSGTTSVTIQFKPFGVKLDFSGLIQNDNSIRIHVAPEVSTLDFSNALTISGFVIPAISTRRAETEIQLKDGQSFGIAGLLDNRATVQMSKVPGLGDLPVLGQFFRSHSINKSHTELLVLVTVHIVDPVHAAMAAAPEEPKLSVPFMEAPKFDRNMPGNNKTEPAPEDPEFKMTQMTAKETVNISPQEGFSPSEPLSLISICLDAETSGAVKLFADSTRRVLLQKHLDDYGLDDAESVFAWIGDPPPDVCLIDFDKDRRRAAAVAEGIHSGSPETAVFAVSSQSQPDAIVQAMRSGCTEYLIKPLNRDQLLSALSRVGGRKKDRKEPYSAQVMAFIGAKGGCGTTTVVTQLGALLANSYARKTLVVDVHSEFGDAALYLGLTKYRYHYLELLENTDRLDAELLQSFVMHHSSGLDLIPAPDGIEPIRNTMPGSVRQVFNFLRLRYEFILMDLGPGLTEGNLELIRYCDQLHIVTVAEVSALRNVVRHIDYLTKQDIPTDRIRVVLNRHNKRGGLITDEQIEKAIGQRIFWKVPNQYVQVVKTISGGDPVSHVSSSDVTRNLNEWAGAVGRKAKKESRGILGLWNR